MAAAIWMFFSGLCGLGLGPVFVGFLSDMFAVGVPAAADPALQKAMVCTGLFNLWGAVHFWLVGMSVKHALILEH